MTTARTPKTESAIRFPDPPEREPDDMTSFDHLSATGNVYHLRQHFGNPETTLITGEHYLSVRPTRNLTGVRYPDLLIAFNADPAAYRRSNAYVISEQGKPPDFVLEIASRRTGREDAGDKRDDYAALGIPEYWRFDETETGRWHGTRLAGDRLAGGRYRPVTIEQLADGSLQGHSQVLNLNLRWERGQLGWYDPATGRHILTYDDQRARADIAEDRADIAEDRADIAEAQADVAEARADREEARADREEARARALEEELRRLRNP